MNLERISFGDCFLELDLKTKLLFCKTWGSEVCRCGHEILGISKKSTPYFYRCRKHRRGQLIADRKDQSNPIRVVQSSDKKSADPPLRTPPSVRDAIAIAIATDRFDRVTIRAVVKLNPSVRSILILELGESFLSCLSSAPR